MCTTLQRAATRPQHEDDMSLVSQQRAMATTLHDILPVLERACAPYRNEPGNLLPILQAVQNELGFIPPLAVPWLAQQLQRSRAEIQGVISFYHDFRQEPPADLTLRICMAESCLAMGAQALHDYACVHLNPSASPTGQAAAACAKQVQTVYCLGLCAQSPCVELNGKPYTHVSKERLEQLLNVTGGMP
jgi:formate dehydrogenase subunit gamma